MSKISDLKILIRENQVEFFSDEELQFYLDRNNGDINKAAYQLLTIKAEDTTLQVAGLSAEDSSKYFRRLANMYKPHNSGILNY